jgi:putative aminopeptidase FrvX
MSEEERKNGLPIEQMVIDVGAVSREDLVKNFKINVGAFVVPDGEFSYNRKSGIMTGKAFDNRVGCAAVIETLSQLENSELQVDVVGAICSQEEVGTRGAKVAVERVKPDLAIVFEGSPADDTYSDKPSAQCALKGGAQIRYLDASLIANPRLARFFRDTAMENNIKFQEAVREAGKTDAGAIALGSGGTPVIVIGVPVRYAHCNYGYCALEDYQASIELCCQVIRRLDKETIDGF